MQMTGCGNKKVDYTLDGESGSASGYSDDGSNDAGGSLAKSLGIPEKCDETPGVEGLGILKGKILRIPPSPGLKIPHMGWNSLHIQNGGRLFKGIPENTYVYFVHSYYLQAEEEEIVKATTQYSTCIHASVEKGNVFACQFHPEKSSRWGLKILENFAALESGTGKEA